MSATPPGTSRADRWYERGTRYTWRPAAGPAAGRDVDIFHVEAGDPDADLVVLIHGWPTCSIDWFDVFDGLARGYRVTALDVPGHGFSDKPPDWPYGLDVDAELVRHHITEVLGRDRCRIVAHDRGDSVALALVYQLTEDPDASGLTVEHLVLTNGNIYLPLASLTPFQEMLLDPNQAPAVVEAVTPEALATGMGATTFTPRREEHDPTVAALAATFAHDDGTAVLADTVKYLHERVEHEVEWLTALSRSTLDTTLVWGLCDTIAPPRVVMHVWEHFVRSKPGSNELWFVPGADHYLQNDRPEALLAVVRAAFDRTGPSPPGPTTPLPVPSDAAVAPTGASPIRVDHSH
ncbi:MAG: alpha/beta hydrolase [Microthrixaceae bacterium]